MSSDTVKQVKLTSESYTCKYCGIKARMIILASSDEQNYDVLTPQIEVFHRSIWHLLECTSAECRKTNVLEDFYGGVNSFDNPIGHDSETGGQYYVPIPKIYRLDNAEYSTEIDQATSSLAKLSKHFEDLVQEKDFRECILSSYREAIESFKNRCYLSTIVLCGSAIEAMIIYCLATVEEEAKEIYHKKNKKSAPNINEWRLTDLIDIANSLKIIKADGFVALDQLRKYRNLIHFNQRLKSELSIKESTAGLVLSILRVSFEEAFEWHRARMSLVREENRPSS
jgi:hypothetical protein